MELTPSRIGARAELEVTAALIRAGKRVYVPCFAADSRVDLVVENDDGFRRVQVKSSVLHGDFIRFSSCSNTNRVRLDYRDDVKLIAVYSPELEQVFVVPVGDAPARGDHLRLSPPRNNQARACVYLLAGPLEAN